MKDKIIYSFVEAQLEVFCSVCGNHFYAFPATGENNSIYFSCEECERVYEFTYDVIPLNANKIIRMKEKNERYTSLMDSSTKDEEDIDKPIEDGI